MFCVLCVCVRACVRSRVCADDHGMPWLEDEDSPQIHFCKASTIYWCFFVGLGGRGGTHDHACRIIVVSP